MALVPARVLAICEDPAEAGLLRTLFGFVPDYQVSLTVAATLRETEYALATRRFDLIVLDADMDGGNAFTWLEELVRGQFAPVLVLQQDANIRRAVEAIRKGALDYYQKSDISPNVLKNVLSEAMKERSVRPARLNRPARPVPPNRLSADRILRRAFAPPAGEAEESGESAPPPVQQKAEPSPSSPGSSETSEKPAGNPAAGAETEAPSPARSQDFAEAPSGSAAPDDLTYSTEGIDREMERLGIRRPWSVLQHIDELRVEIDDLQKRVVQSPSPDVFQDIQECARRIASGIRSGIDLFSILHAELPEERLVNAAHALNVCVIAICIARNCDFSEEETVLIGAAALLYRAAAPESDDVAAAAAAAADLAKKVGAPSNVVLALEQMPERADGSGPRGLRGREIMIDAQVLLLADTLDRLYFHGVRFLEKAFPGLNVADAGITTDPLFVVVNYLRSWFQPRVLKALISANGFFSVGTIVQLNNGAVARVVAPNPNRPTQPVVEIIRTSFGETPKRATRIDLSQTPGIAIRRVLSYNPTVNA